MIGSALLAVLVLIILVVVGMVAVTAYVARRAEALVPAVGRFVTVDGLRLHYLDEGAGPVILMIHGLASQLQTFTHSLSPLLRDRYRLIILDRPGNGYSQAAPAAGLHAKADLIASFLRTLDIDRALVVGHSMGGAIALALAVQHPERVAGLALIAPLTQLQDEVPETLRGLALRSAVARFVVGWTLAVPGARLTQNKALEALFAPDPVAPDFGTRGGAMLPLRPWGFRNASRDLVEVAGDLATYAKRHRELAMPVGVLFGTGDNILDYRRHGEGLATSLSSIDLELIRGGHMLPLTQPQASATFIDRIAERARVHVRP